MNCSMRIQAYESEITLNSHFLFFLAFKHVVVIDVLLLYHNSILLHNSCTLVEDRRRCNSGISRFGYSKYTEIENCSSMNHGGGVQKTKALSG